MVPGQNEPNVLDRIIASYEWLLKVAETIDNDERHAEQIAKFNLEELKQFKRLAEKGEVSIISAEPQSSAP